MTRFDWAAFVIAALIGVILGLAGMIAGLLRLAWVLTVDEDLGLTQDPFSVR
jgi:hypothetical protein